MEFSSRYYAYRVSSHRDIKKKSAVKITDEYLGVVSIRGIVKKQSLTEIRGDYDYRNVAFLYQVAGKKIIPFVREIFPYLSKIMDESMTPFSLSFRIPLLFSTLSSSCSSS
jgi:hypothetical protein